MLTSISKLADNVSTRMKGIIGRKKTAGNSLRANLVNDLSPTSCETSKQKSLLSDPLGQVAYNSTPKLLRLVRANGSVPLGVELENPTNLTSNPGRNRKRGSAETAGSGSPAAENGLPGLRVAAVWVGGVANMAGVAEGDMVVGVNNVSWNVKAPRKSGSRLKAELFNCSSPTIDLMILSRA